jgi:hypothetical protein
MRSGAAERGRNVVGSIGPHHVDLSVKRRRRRDLHREIAEDDALDP